MEYGPCASVSMQMVKHSRSAVRAARQCTVLFAQSKDAESTQDMWVQHTAHNIHN